MDTRELARLIDPEGRLQNGGAGRIRVRCPGHPDKSPSLNVWIDDDGKAALNCFAGCDQDRILSGLPTHVADQIRATWGANVTVLLPRRRHSPAAPAQPATATIEAEYPYITENGELAYLVRRYPGKKIRQFHPNGSGTLVKGRGDAALIPYRLPDVLAANKAGDTIYIVEGEKDADTLAERGITATCNVGGAGKWTDNLDGWFAGAHVVILPDNDDPGRAHAQQVYEHLKGVAETVRIVTLPDLPDKGDVTDWLEDHSVDELEALARQTDTPDPDLAAFLDSPEPEYDWIIEGLIERGDRVIITGGEGSGKSTLLRQFAVTAGSGIHPFTLADIPPCRCLYIDLENSVRQSRRQFRPLRAKAGRYLQPGHVTPVIRPEGLDLLDAEDSQWLEDRIRVNRPDIVILGPIYKLVGGDPTEEQPAKAAATLLDRLRVEYGFALLMEAHSPHGETGRKRPKRPYGASLWLRWPEFGLHIDERGNISHWRGARDERSWPSILQRGGEWPWSPLISPQDILWGQIVGWCEGRLTRPSIREIAHGLDSAATTVQRAIKAHEDIWKGMWEDQP